MVNHSPRRPHLPNDAGLKREKRTELDAQKLVVFSAIQFGLFHKSYPKLVWMLGLSSGDLGGFSRK